MYEQIISKVNYQKQKHLLKFIKEGFEFYNLHI